MNSIVSFAYNLNICEWTSKKYLRQEQKNKDFTAGRFPDSMTKQTKCCSFQENINSFFLLGIVFPKLFLTQVYGFFFMQIASYHNQLLKEIPKIRAANFLKKIIIKKYEMIKGATYANLRK